MTVAVTEPDPAPQVSESAPWRDVALPCADPDCAGLADPETDGEHRYHECTRCGFAFGWQKVPTSVVAVDAQGTCAIGVPEAVRRRAAPSTQSASPSQPAPPVLLQIGRRPPDAPTA